VTPEDDPLAPGAEALPSTPAVTDEATAAALARRIDEPMEHTLLLILAYSTDLALAAAEAIVQHAALTDPRVLENSLQQALSHITDLAVVDLHVHPDDAALARDLCARLRHGPSATVSPDPAISRGGCLALTDFGEVDATMEGQLRRLAEALRP
jgi:flagellar biosynthesis/type III secretory pathway protein FliH